MPISSETTFRLLCGIVAWTRCNCEMLSTESNFGSNGFLLRITDIIFPKSRKREQNFF